MSVSKEQTEGSYVELAAVYVGLLVLLGLTIVFALVPISPTLALVLALGIAGAKTGLIMWHYMHLKDRPRVVWIFAAAGFMWLMIMFGLTLSDYITRWWILIEP